MVTAEERTVILAAQNGSINAFRRLVFNFDADILRLGMRIAASDEDARCLYLDTVLKIHEELPGFQFECAFYIWVCRHFSAVSSDYLKSKRAPGPGVIDATLNKLTPRKRLAVELKNCLRESLQIIDAGMPELHRPGREEESMRSKTTQPALRSCV
jgi:hypothetical protein